jgi:hypothetical protein
LTNDDRRLTIDAWEASDRQIANRQSLAGGAMICVRGFTT